MDDRRFVLSLLDLPAAKFAAHGRIDGWVRGNILCIQATGPFNREMVEEYFAARRAIVERWKPSSAIGTLVVFEESMIFGIEAFKAFEETIRRGVPFAAKTCAVAWVATPAVEGFSIMPDKMAELFRRYSRVPFRFFEDEEEARAWVESEIAQQLS